MKNLKLLAGILVFGSLWGFSECIIGSGLSEFGLPTGAIMTGFFAITFLVISRMTYRQPGMQLGMGLVAGALRLFNPFVGCHLCSALAIMAEGAIFEVIWYKISLDLTEIKPLTMQISMGIISAYFVYIGGYIITQIFTPIVSGSGFFIENLITFMPNILSSGLLSALIGAFVLPVILLTKKIDLRLKDRLYYPTTIGISVFCWLFVVGNWFLLS
ncbi:MAG: hypothetical protein AYK22_03325 [Thermoplasmatales archaeon SG8-52-3]|nr:MAG: hypothetical protein AYK22_03325 [Thermoplasmatales archaeon SG8-52-3]